MTRRVGWALVAMATLGMTLVVADDAQARRRGGGSWGNGGWGSNGGWAGNGSWGGNGSFGGRFSRRRGNGSCGSHGGYVVSNGSHGGGSHGGGYYGGEAGGVYYGEGRVQDGGAPVEGERREAQYRGEIRAEGRPMPAPELRDEQGRDGVEQRQEGQEATQGDRAEAPSDQQQPAPEQPGQESAAPESTPGDTDQGAAPGAPTGT